MRKNSKLLTLTFILFLTACGGESSQEPVSNNPLKTIPPSVSIEVIEGVAIEKNSQVAKFKITRDSDTEALLINYALTGNADETLGSASNTDYQLKYADGSDVGSSIIIDANNSSRIIELVPINDGINEVPETLI
ncbi:MAG: hypothetical protein HRT37_20065 [Alteromonadaceae bacterium]|nr:hypothetical protein [Alteromonadaceae bacterium]